MFTPYSKLVTQLHPILLDKRGWWVISGFQARREIFRSERRNITEVWSFWNSYTCIHSLLLCAERTAQRYSNTASGVTAFPVVSYRDALPGDCNSKPLCKNCTEKGTYKAQARTPQAHFPPAAAYVSPTNTTPRLPGTTAVTWAQYSKTLSDIRNRDRIHSQNWVV